MPPPTTLRICDKTVRNWPAFLQHLNSDNLPLWQYILDGLGPDLRTQLQNLSPQNGVDPELRNLVLDKLNEASQAPEPGPFLKALSDSGDREVRTLYDHAGKRGFSVLEPSERAWLFRRLLENQCEGHVAETPPLRNGCGAEVARECDHCGNNDKALRPCILDRFQIFGKSSRKPDDAFHCQACGNYWIPLDQERDCDCPRCDAHGNGETTTVWVTVGQMGGEAANYWCETADADEPEEEGSRLLGFVENRALW